MKSPMIKRMKQLTAKVEPTTPWYIDLLGVITLGFLGYILTILAFCL